MKINLVLCWLIRTPILYKNNINPSRFYFRYKSTMANKSEHSGLNRPKFVDIGANLTDSTYEGYYHGSHKHKPDLEKVLERAKAVGMEKIIITSDCLEAANKALKICNKYDQECKFLYTTVGVHPTRCNVFLKNKFGKTDSEYLEALDQLISNNRERVVALGELGLDYDRLHFCDTETQKKYFEYQLTLAEKHKLPLFLHMRNASRDFFGRSVKLEKSLDIMSRNKHKWVQGGGVVHSYTGDEESLKELLSEDLYVGVNGCSLKTEDNLKTVQKMPLDRLMLETDCPWCGIKSTHASSKLVKTKFNSIKRPEAMTGETMLSSRNEPCCILNVAEVVHQLVAKDMEFTQFCDRVFENTLSLFKGLRD